MANFFDQFDEQPSAKATPNFFDQFDAPAAPEPSSFVGDVAKSFGSGVVRGTAETAMLPVTAKRLADSGADWLFDKGEGLVRSVFGMDEPSAETLAARDQARGVIAATDAPIYAGQDAIRRGMDSALHKPETRTGKFARTIGEFVAPGAIPGRAVRGAPTAARAVSEYAGDFFGNVIAPAILSEGAGQLTEGTAAEPYARVGGALVGNVGAAAGRAYNAPEAMVRRATSDMTDGQWQEATRLQNNTTGVRLTGPEAIAQATGGASALPNLQRVIEGSTEGRAATAPFFAARPGQVDTATGRVLDKISPQDAAPTTLGVRASDAATDALRGVEEARTAAVQPLYKAANTDNLAAPDVAGVIAQLDAMAASDRTGILRGPLNELRGRLIATPARPGAQGTRTPVTGPDGQIIRYQTTPAVPATPEMPITDIENLDRTRKYFRDRLDLPQIGQDAITKEQGASITDILTRLDTLMERGSQSFAAGKQRYAQISRDVVDPAANGPLGQVASAKSTPTAGNAILPQNPLTGSADELSDTVAALFGQDPQTTAALVRQNLGDRFSKAGTETMEGNREFAGAKFHKDVAGNPTREEVLDAVLSKLPGAPNVDMNELLEVLQATGRRKQIGSATAFNEGIKDQLGAASPFSAAVDVARTAGVSFLTRASDATKRAALRGNVQELGDMFVDPNSVDLIRNAINRGWTPGALGAVPRAAGQTLPILDRERR